VVEGAAVAAEAPVSVLVADAHPVVRLAEARLLDAQPGFRVVGEAGSYGEVARALERGGVEVLVLGLPLGDVPGTEPLRRLRPRHPEVRIVASSGRDDEAFVQGVLDGGACGWVLKRSPVDRLCAAVRAVAAGERYLDTNTACAAVASAARARAEGRCLELTRREWGVLAQVASGRRNRDIALTLRVSESTVKFHLSALFQKLGVSNRTELAHLAVRQRLLCP
jgi:two-component system invasion response regulator UvrY